MHINSSKKGYSMVNMLLILMTVMLISACTYKMIHNNTVKNSIKYRYKDLYDIEKLEKSISEVNFYIKTRNIKLDEITIEGEIINIDGKISLQYNKKDNNFKIVDIRDERKEIDLRYKKVDGFYYLLPLGEKYML